MSDINIDGDGNIYSGRDTNIFLHPRKMSSAFARIIPAISTSMGANSEPRLTRPIREIESKIAETKIVARERWIREYSQWGGALEGVFMQAEGSRPGTRGKLQRAIRAQWLQEEARLSGNESPKADEILESVIQALSHMLTRVDAAFDYEEILPAVSVVVCGAFVSCEIPPTP